MEVKLNKRKPYHGATTKSNLEKIIVETLKQHKFEKNEIAKVKGIINDLWEKLETKNVKVKRQMSMTPARKAHIEKMKARGKKISELMKNKGLTLAQASKQLSQKGAGVKVASKKQKSKKSKSKSKSKTKKSKK